MFKRILIPQQGLPAVRIARACRRADIESVGWAPSKDENVLHANACDHMLKLDASEADTNAIMDLLNKGEADAVYARGLAHPLQEELFALAAEKSFSLIGADRASLSLSNSRESIVDTAQSIGLQVLPASTRSAKATHIKREIPRTRVLTVLVVRDAPGETLALCEIEWIENEAGAPLIAETPSPYIHNQIDSDAYRSAIFEQSMRFMDAYQHAGIAALDFSLDAQGRIWFEGLTPSIEPFYALAEFVTGQDIIGLDFSIAAGQALPDELKSMQPSGHAASATLNVSLDADPTQTLEQFFVPPAPQGKLRIESALLPNQELSTQTWPMLARLNTYAPIRHHAVLYLDRMLAEIRVTPHETNVELLRKVLNDHAFRAGQYDVEFASRVAAAEAA